MDLSQLNDQQKTVLKQLREAVKDCKLKDDSDLALLRFLIARDFDLSKSEKMIRNAQEIRSKYRADHILQEFTPPKVLLQYFPAGPLGQDKKLFPLWLVRYGRADMKGILSSVKKKDYLSYVLYLVEQNIATVNSNMAKYQLKPGDSMVQATMIFDLEGFGMQHITHKPTMDSSLQITQLYEATCPELLHKVLVINAPKVFAIAFNMMKRFMHERTRNKISIYSHDEKTWKAALLAEINADQLPKMYGGTMTDPDGNPCCITKCSMGGPVPKNYFFSSHAKFDPINKKSLTVGSGSKEQLEYQVHDRESAICWDFYSEESDIAFAIYYKKGDELVPIVSSERVDSHVSPEEGEIHCEEPGTYVIEFDNSFSYLRSKKIWYLIKITVASSATESEML